MAILVPVNGALEGAWSWNRFVVPRLRASGHTVFATTLIGLGDRTDLAHPGIDLDTHVQDIVNVLYCEDLQDVIRVGHSYGGSDYRRRQPVGRPSGALGLSRCIVADAFGPCRHSYLAGDAGAHRCRW